MMHIILDGNPVSAEPGEMILDAAHRAGIDIPSLCRLPGSPSQPHGTASPSCLVCLVKLGDKFVPSCAVAVEEGVVVESETEEVWTMRRSALELLLSDHISHCRTCGEGRKKCRLLKYIAKYQVNRYRFGQTEKPEDILYSDRVAFDSRKCIKCGICVAISRQSGEKTGLALFGRGFETHIGVPFDEPLQKGIEQSAEKIVPSCPTAALTWRK